MGTVKNASALETPSILSDPRRRQWVELPEPRPSLFAGCWKRSGPVAPITLQSQEKMNKIRSYVPEQKHIASANQFGSIIKDMMRIEEKRSTTKIRCPQLPLVHFCIVAETKRCQIDNSLNLLVLETTHLGGKAFRLFS
jgi:hypothetical protein